MAPRIRIGIATTAVGLLLGGAFVMTRRADDPSSFLSAGPVASDPHIVLSSDRLEFGDGTNGSVVRQVLLRNGGSVSAHVRVETEGAGFVVDPTKLDLEAGEIGRISVTAGPIQGARRPGELRIFTDGASAPLRVALGGGVSPDASARAIEDLSQNDGNGEPLGAEAMRRSADGTPISGPSGPFVPSNLTGTVEIARVTERSDDPSSASDESAGEVSDPAPSPGTPASYAPPIARSISDPPSGAKPTDPPRQGEKPQPIDRKPVTPSDPPTDRQDPSEPRGNPTFAVSEGSTLTLLGSANQFYPQNVGVAGSATGGSFHLASTLALPRVPLAFGESMVFNQNGSAAGRFEPGSGTVTLELPVQAVDANGNAAPFMLSMTTGTVVGRNNNGVLISVTGQPRSQGSGTLRLVGIGKIPAGYRNGAEEQFVTVQMTGSLNFPEATSAEVRSGSTGGGN